MNGSPCTIAPYFSSILRKCSDWSSLFLCILAIDYIFLVLIGERKNTLKCNLMTKSWISDVATKPWWDNQSVHRDTDSLFPKLVRWDYENETSFGSVDAIHSDRRHKTNLIFSPAGKTKHMFIFNKWKYYVFHQCVVFGYLQTIYGLWI